MKYIPLIFILLLEMVSVSKALAQASSQVNTVQPRLMIVPFLKQGEDLREKLEENDLFRKATTLIAAKFGELGFEVKDALTEIKSYNRSSGMTSGSRESLPINIIQGSGCDIVIEFDILGKKHTLNNTILTSLEINMNAKDLFSSKVLASTFLESKPVHTTNYDLLLDVAIRKKNAQDLAIDPFLNSLQESFDRIRIDGRTVSVDIRFHQDSELTLDDEMGADDIPLVDLLEDWFGENSYKNYYNIQGFSSNFMLLDDVRIPLKDIKKRNYNPSRLASSLSRYLRDLGVKNTRSVNATDIFIIIK